MMAWSRSAIARSAFGISAIFASTSFSPSAFFARGPRRASAFSSWARAFIAARSSSVNPVTALPFTVALLAGFCVCVLGLIEQSSSGRNLCPEFPGPRRERRQPLDFQVGARAEQLDPLRREHREVDRVAPPVRTPAVVVGEALLARQLLRADEQACAMPHLRLSCQRGDPASYEHRPLRH